MPTRKTYKLPGNRFNKNEVKSPERQKHSFGGKEVSQVLALDRLNNFVIAKSVDAVQDNDEITLSTQKSL